MGTDVILALLAVGALVAAVLLLSLRDERGLERVWGQLVSPSAAARTARDTLAARLMAQERALDFTRRRSREAAAVGDRTGAASLARASQEFERQTRVERRRLSLLRRMLSAIQGR